MDSYEFSKKIVDGYLAFYEDKKSPGFEQTATLTAIDSRNFKDRLIGPVSELANHMNAELSKPGEKNQKFNYYDEYIASAISYAYSEPEMLDLGSFAGTLGISMYEIDNDPFYEDLSNSYSGISTNLQKVLADQDSSGDDVLYNRFTKDLTKENGNKMGVVRGRNFLVSGSDWDGGQYNRYEGFSLENLHLDAGRNSDGRCGESSGRNGGCPG